LAIAEFAFDSNAHPFLLRDTALRDWDTTSAGSNSVWRKQNATHRKRVMIVAGGCMIFF
jgi:hypothetical protein